MKRLPSGPILASLFLMIVGGFYFASFRKARREGPSHPPPVESPGVWRVVSWNLRAGRDGRGANPDTSAETVKTGESGLAPESLVEVLASLQPHVVVLQEAPDEEFAHFVARGLGSGWNCVSARRSTDAPFVLAIGVHPSLRIEERRLIPSPTPTPDDALMVTLVGAHRRPVHVVNVAASETDPARRCALLKRVVIHVQSQFGVSILAGTFHLEGKTPSERTHGSASECEEVLTSRLAAGFQGIAAEERTGNMMFISNSNAQVHRSFTGPRVAGDSDTSLPLIADIEIK
jgi:hypothetical protein